MITARFVGSYVNQVTKYYYVQPIFSWGRGQIQGPATVTRPTFLDDNNFVYVSWRQVEGALRYDVIVTDSGTVPTGNISSGWIGVTSALTIRDVGQNDDWTYVAPASVNLADTDDLPEGSTNLYYSNARVSSVIDSIRAADESVLAVGTAYTLTTTPTALDFGTTDPAIVLGAAGTYLISFRARVDAVGATFAASEEVTIKLRRTNNTPADVTGGALGVQTGVITTFDLTLGLLAGAVIYTTANDDDALTLFGDISDLPGAGQVDVTAAQIIAVRLS